MKMLVGIHKRSTLLGISVIFLTGCSAIVGLDLDNSEKPVVRASADSLKVKLTRKYSNVSAGERVVLTSRFHDKNGRVSSGVLKPMATTTAAGGAMYETVIPTPEYAPPGSEPVCFYLRDSKGRMIRGINGSLTGFYLPGWEAYKREVLSVNSAQNSLIAIKESLHDLQQHYDAASKRLSANPAFQGQSCQLTRTGTRPLKPASLAFGVTHDLANALCANYNGPGLRRGDANRIVVSNLERGNAFDSTAHSDLLRRIDRDLAGSGSLSSHQKTAHRLYADYFSKRGIDDSRVYDSVFQAFNACQSSLRKNLDAERQQYQRLQYLWQEKPAQDLTDCKRDADVVVNYEEQKDRLEDRLAEMNSNGPGTQTSPFKASKQKDRFKHKLAEDACPV